MTIKDLLAQTVSQFEQADLFYGHGFTNAYQEASFLLAKSLDLPFDFTENDSVLRLQLEPHQLQTIYSLVKKRTEELIPLPYLLHEAYFAGLSFYVDERVLIPRSPIFELIETGFKPWYLGAEPARVLDLCTGSGCIGIAVAKHFNNAEVVLADLSEDALAVAEMNIQRHQLQHRVTTEISDLLQSIAGQFDIIVANPPYVDSEDFAAMPNEYQHEPAMALASGPLGLDHPLAILRNAEQHLSDDGVLIMEVGNSGMHLENLYPEIDFNWLEFNCGGFGVLAMSKIELEMAADVLALNRDYSDFEQ